MGAGSEALNRPVRGKNPEKARLRKRRAYLRKKVRMGRKLTDRDRAELADMPASRWVRTPAEASPTDDQDAGAPSEVEGAPPPPPPPRVVLLPAPGAEPADWRDKYRRGAGREGACVELAGLWCSLLKKASAFIESTGARPILSPAQVDEIIHPAAVLTADRLLPAEFELGPEAELVIGSSMLLGQAAVVATRSRARDKVPRGTSSQGGAGMRPESPAATEKSADAGPNPAPGNGARTRPIQSDDVF
jgi:hypothetical protein